MRRRALAIAFNVAASIKMRKYGILQYVKITDLPLQCGRIYKDAEIGRTICTVSRPEILLQCGRIYKDAEIDGCMPPA